ncbi:MAG: histone deacetylase family protein [Planctomycetes bacterium]|nr:histone deacetylase family protein [Planctomycetota bacterium]MCB9890998.1 histone deacetylase family protein [Planctomycetota bacterium]MCB9919149.1 histone deacetylase family protein [Planctomycetota bacterium]
MFRIRQIDDETLPGNRRDLARVQEILRKQLPGLSAEEIDTLPLRLRDPLRHQMRAMLFVADDMRGHLHSFALLSYAPDIGFCLLDYIASGKVSGGGGIGGALYDRVRSAARELDCVGLFFECLPDDPEACSDPSHAKQNAARLRFYERYGARPIIHTGYETPLKPGDLDLPYLVFDDLDAGRPLEAHKAREVVRAILERKYGDICPEGYIDDVVASFRDDPVRLREPRYVSKSALRSTVVGRGQITLVVNNDHDIHHVRERGYVEAPVRIRSILKGVEGTKLFDPVEPRAYGDEHLTRVHSPELVSFLDRACKAVPAGKSVYPYVFPVRNRTRMPDDISYCAGYYCIDTFTPLNQNAYLAARRAVNCALTAADSILEGRRLAYALVRPPGHHAEHGVFGGFCYFNNNAIAADHLARTASGKVAILDIDYHHGNGQQDIFYARDDVLTVSIHGEPRIAYPFFSGFEEERGEGVGLGYNLNLPLPETIEFSDYVAALDRALDVIREFGPTHLVVALGLDTAKRDPTGTWPLQKHDFENVGLRIGKLGLPTLVVQEGGYRTVSLGANARAFFSGLAAGIEGIPATVRQP